MIEQILGWSATILFSLMIVPQLIKTVQTHDVKGVSIGFYYLFFIGNIIALIYACLINQYPLQFKYTFALMISLVYILTYYYYKGKK